MANPGDVDPKTLAKIINNQPTAPRTAAIHAFFEEWQEEGCVHFDKGYGPYAQCEDPDQTVPIHAIEHLCAEAAAPADDRLRFHPLTGDADFEEASLSDRLDAIISHARSEGFGEGYRAAAPAAGLREALDRMVPILAQMMRAEALCDRGHRKGNGEHYHFETVHEWARLLNQDRLAALDAATRTRSL